MTRQVCYDCGRKRDPFQQVVWTVGKRVLWVCRQCWRDHDYAEFMIGTPGSPV